MNKTNKNITFKGNKLTVTGTEIREGQKIPAFTVVGTDMSDITLERFKGKTVVISTVPSLDTPVCSVETKRFNAEAQKLSSDIAILTISLDLPFAQQRWCGAEGVENVTVASDYKYRQVGEALGVYIKEMGLLARAIFVVGKDSVVRYVEYVPAISDEPQYSAALEAAKTA
ncbi:MAG: thiol peroxidase [Oligoflexia bacterium]|nr:thiol peroxidase [Oligoflexia bacterium]